MTDNYNFAVRSHSKLVDDQVRIVATKVVQEAWNYNAEWALQVTLAVGGVYKPARNVIVISDFGAFSLTFYTHVSVDVAPRDIIIFFLLASTQAIYCSTCSKLFNYLRFPNDKGVKTLGERVLPDFHNYPLIEFMESRSENVCHVAHFVLLGESCLLHLANERLMDGLKVRIDDEKRFTTILVLVEFNLGLFGAPHQKYMKHRHEVVSGAKYFLCRPRTSSNNK